MDPLLVIADRGAGSSEEEDLDVALAVLRRHADVEVAHTSDPGELDGVLHRAGSRRLVVAGGDGSLHAVVAALHKRNELGRSCVALIPLGVGNDFARGNDIPLDPAEAARVAVSATSRPVDLLVDEVGEVVVDNVRARASTSTSRRGARWKELLRTAALAPPFVRLRVEVDGELVADFDHPVLMVTVGNPSRTGTVAAPDAGAGDGQVDVTVSFATGAAHRVRTAWTRLARHPVRAATVTRRGTTVSISGQEFWCTADGEIYGPERHRTWTVHPAAFRMVLP